MSDIVERLRSLDRDAYDWFAVVDKAADTIERHMREKVELAGLVAKERDDNTRLRGDIETLQAELRYERSARRALEPKP